MKKIFKMLSIMFLGLFAINLVSCGESKEEKYTKGLKFTLSSDEKSYMVEKGRAIDVADIVIPSKYKGKPVKTITISGFSDCSMLETVVLPRSIEIISNEAFKNCVSLKYLYIPSSVSHMGENVFYNCKNTILFCEHEQKPNGWSNNWNRDANNGSYFYLKTYRGVSAFETIDDIQYCIAKGKAIISKYLGNEDNVVIPSSITINKEVYNVTEIGDYSFYSGTFNNITISEGIENIGHSAFRNCDNIKDIYIPNGVKKIYSSSFEGCNNLETVRFPKSLEAIDESAFWYCNNLETVYYAGTKDTWDFLTRTHDGYDFSNSLNRAEIVCNYEG